MNLNNGYIEIYMPQHPNARSNGTILEHRYVAEQKLGRLLKNTEVVHHIDENRKNNNPENLIVFKTNSDHSRFHKTGKKQLMDDGTWICPIPENHIKKCKCCKNYFVRKDNIKFCCRECYIEYQKKHLCSQKKPNKDVLLELITNKSFVEIGKQYGVSGNAIRKWCKSYNLPYKYKDLHNDKKKEDKTERLLYDATYQVKMFDENIEMIFDNIDDAINYLIENKIIKNNISLKGVKDNISNAHRKNSKYHGFYY